MLRQFQVAKSLKLDCTVREGVYVMVGGPSYESVSEVRMLRGLGADSVGMSTIPEVLVAIHCGMKVFACSLITNICVGEYDTGMNPNHEEVMESGKKQANNVKKFIAKMVEEISKDSVELETVNVDRSTKRNQWGKPVKMHT